MKYIDDDEYGVMWLVKIRGTEWYIQVEEDYPYYVKLDKSKVKVSIATRELPISVSDLM